MALLLAVCFPSVGISRSVSHTPTAPEAAEILNAVCPGSYAIDSLMAPRRILGCKPCPSFTERDGLGIGHRDSLDLETVIYGSFSAPGAQEAVATFYGCVDHAAAANFRSSVVLAKRQNVWQMEPYGYKQGIDASQCQAYNLQDGRQVLLCRSFEGHPDVSYGGIERWDFEAVETMRSLIGTINTWGACREKALEESISDFQILRLPTSSVPGVSVTVNVVQASCPGRLGVCAGSCVPPPPVDYRVDFLYEGGDFVVAPWSRSTKEHLDALVASASK
jgi:hypothetical protein